MNDIDFILNQHNSAYLAKVLVKNFKKMRINRNYTQKELASRSGIALSILKRFEQKTEISLSNLLRLAVILDAVDGFDKLFIFNEINSLDDYLEQEKSEEEKE